MVPQQSVIQPFYEAAEQSGGGTERLMIPQKDVLSLDALTDQFFRMKLKE